MRFYNRENELKLLDNTRKSSLVKSKMTVVIGRRRIGKTSLIIKSVELQDFIYLFVSKKNEPLLCREFQIEIEEKTGLKAFGEITRFKDLFEFLMVSGQSKHFTLIIDEFQEFFNINPSLYSDMQNLWDKYKDTSKINLILCGSVYSLMKGIFENSKEPLFGRANEKIQLKPFSPDILKTILAENNPGYTKHDLLAFYIFTGGVPKYIELFVDKSVFTLEQILNEIFRENSILLEEGKNLLIEEFGKEYSTYFSILSLIASSKNSRQEIESILQKNVGGYLDRLEKEYSIIKRNKPVFSKPEGRMQIYYIEDNFLNFWFRFVYKYRSAIEIENFGYIKEIVNRDFSSWSGKFLKKYFIEKLILEKNFSQIGNYWEKGANNEIDIIAINELEKKALVAEVKINSQKINLEILKNKAKQIIPKLEDYTIEYMGFSIDDM
jgi:AAA+ ATPase superfamily predicted ATPase